jgi:hypothetical protein
MTPQVVSNEGHCRRIRLTDGEFVDLEANDDFTCIVARNGEGREIGRIEFHLIEGAAPFSEEILHLKWAYLDKLGAQYTRRGIGREIVRMASEGTGLRVHATENDGQTRDDGSHLTQDAPAFVESMMDEGLIVDHRCYPDEDSFESQ